MALPVFISYAREDGDFAHKLADDLRSNGVAVWIDSTNIRTGEPWDQAIERALTECSDMVVVLSPDSVSSRSVMDEIAFALDRGKRVLPVLARACRVLLQVSRIQYADFTDSYDVGIATVKRALSLETVTTQQDPPKRSGLGRKLLLGAGFGLLISVIVLLSKFNSGDTETTSSMFPVLILWSVIGVVTWSPLFVLTSGHPERVRWAAGFAIAAIVITWLALAPTGFIWGVFVSGPSAAIVGALFARYRHRRKTVHA